MKLSILVPHYKEPAGVIKPLLDSINLQQSVDLHAAIEVIICHDGREEDGVHEFWFTYNVDNCMPDEFGLPDIYNFPIIQIRQDHKGVSAARNACLEVARGDYVMFCDVDDMFCDVCGLYMIFNEINKNGNFDSLVSCFVEETRNPVNKDILYLRHEIDSTFVHGKIHRRRYLIEQNIRWNENFTIHEDSYFNILCQNLSKNVKHCPKPFYLWKWRDDSVCRHDPKYVLKTYKNLIDSNDALIGEFLKRNVQDKAVFYVVFMIFDAYYTMNKPDWINQENKEYRDSTERRFADYYKKYKDIWLSAPTNDKMIASNQIRGRNVLEGMQMEAITIDAWLQHVEQLPEVTL